MEPYSPSRWGSNSPPSARRNAPHSAPGSKRKRTNGRAEANENQAGRDSTPESTGSYDEHVYDPDQPLAERRKVQKRFRELLRDVTENSEEYLQSGSHGLYDAIIKANELTKQVRQTTEATIDSRLLVSTTDLSYRKTLRLTQGSLSQGVDVDEFVSKCITFMRQERGNASGGGQGEDGEEDGDTATQQRRRRDNSNGMDDPEDRDGDMMNWGHLGRFACLPHSRRPALPGLLLGPLSVERKIRRVTKRSAPFRPNSLAETRPEILNTEDLARKENDLTAICGKIFQQLQDTQEQVQGAVAAAIRAEMSDEEQIDIMHRHGLRRTGGIDLMRFVVNPKSFGQTVENIFYVSFLIRDGRIEIEYDEYSLPALAPVVREEHEDESARQGSAKHQAVLSIDMRAWKDIIDTLQIKESMIEHRQEIANSGPGAKGWYS
ncbi:nuclear protein Qri2/Nse4, putative [Cordyceps militaris CM01]|uniref:Non-structural maintenance of chromosomes element 4 n=2 Tax=Cordyceps militaris TaxID=73501 RepID=G3JAB9_CORMM|nr:nuclear protein Qri2/Nse4, putative [Cordyceps militaris CM01]ATY61112.1 nuclear Qri2 [Cordyceps militaris]EGX95087.1 nuclear protein Qri2/Nse4, putative [Cordyceps militaris CM01]